jgi:hypothetical protein
MADYTLTAASVLKGANASTATGIAGATITAGQALYIDTTASNVLKLADADASLAASTVAGIALNGGATGQPITYVTDDDDFTHGLATPAASDVIILSSTAGALCPVSDLSSGEFPQIVMVAKSATKAVLKLVAGGVAKA